MVVLSQNWLRFAYSVVKGIEYLKTNVLSVLEIEASAKKLWWKAIFNQVFPHAFTGASVCFEFWTVCFTR